MRISLVSWADIASGPFVIFSSVVSGALQSLIRCNGLVSLKSEEINRPLVGLVDFFYAVVISIALHICFIET